MDELEQWIDQLNGDDIERAIEAAEKLGQIGGVQAQNALKERFAPYRFMSDNTQEENKLFFTIALVLAEMGNYHEYSQVVNEDAPFVRVRVKEILESIGKERAIQAALAMRSSSARVEHYWAKQILAIFRASKRK